MVEINEKQVANWAKNAPAHLTKTLDAFLSAEQMPQAYLFLGSSVEDATARNLVQNFAEKITNSAFPNVDSVIFDAADGTGVEGIREVLELAALMPVASARKAVVLFNMQAASVQMQNALLKTLEQPPEHATFLLISTTPVLPTIMSRCQVFAVHGAHAANNDLAKELSPELTEALALLTSNRSAGQAERMVLVNSLADLEDELLPQVLETWLNMQVLELRTAPQKFPAVRVTMETLQSLRGNFNKKMVLQNFVTAGLV
ncbi:MAG TPA: hypothetical protein VHQ41_02925 [Patescibacteria group bacterium]|jgi:hypothetical protein|nr:hypothetical protein [Patescibacteria group bacterium]